MMLTPFRSIGFILVLGLLLPASSGCKRNPIASELIPVHGTVKYQGKPIAEAHVTFIPEIASDEEGNAAFGRTDAQGRYELTTLTPGDGAVPGKYRVTITKTAPPKGASSVAGNLDVNSEEYAAARAKRLKTAGQGAVGKKAAAETELLPLRYGAKDTSRLSAEITQSNTEFNFDLK